MKLSSKKGRWWFEQDDVLMICCPKCGYTNRVIIVKVFSRATRAIWQIYKLIGENRDTLYPIFVCKKIKCNFEANIILS